MAITTVFNPFTQKLDINQGGATVDGPGSSTNNAIAKWNGTTGTLLSDSGVLIDSTNNITGINSAAITAPAFTTQTALQINGDSLTTGYLVNAWSNSSSTSARTLFNFEQTNVLATGATTVNISNVSTGNALSVTGKINTIGTSSIVLNDVIGALRAGSVIISSPYLADGVSPALYFRSTDDNADKPKAAIFSKTTGGGSYLYLGTSTSYASGVNQTVSVSPDAEVGCQGVVMGGNRTFVSASSNAYAYHTTALGLVMYGNGTTDDFTLASAGGANILSVATGTTTARFFGAVNIGGTFTRRTQSGVLSQFQIEGTDFDTSSMSLFANNNSFATTCSALFLSRSRGTAVNSNTIVQNGDRLGIMLFMGTDGIIPQAGAIIQASVDGAPAAGSMPTKLELMTSHSGSVSPVVGLTIRSTGAIEINNTVAAGAAVASTHKVTMVIGGSTYYLLASNV